MKFTTYNMDAGIRFPLSSTAFFVEKYADRNKKGKLPQLHVDK